MNGPAPQLRFSAPAAPLQSVQSVPRAQTLNCDPGPPSSQLPSWAVAHVSTQQSVLSKIRTLHVSPPIVLSVCRAACTRDKAVFTSGDSQEGLDEKMTRPPLAQVHSSPSAAHGAIGWTNSRWFTLVSVLGPPSSHQQRLPRPARGSKLNASAEQSMLCPAASIVEECVWTSIWSNVSSVPMSE